MSEAAVTSEDQVDRIREQWHLERPDIDTSGMAIIGRISRISRRLDTELLAVFRQFGLTDWEFDVLASLRRSGTPYQMTPTALMNGSMITSGAVTNRAERLAKRGLVYRQEVPGDRRSNLIGLTAEGLRIVDEVLVAHVANEERLLSSLSAQERAMIEPLLRKLLSSLEQAS